MNVLSITIQIVCFFIQVASIAVNVHLYHKNTNGYLQWHDRSFLRLRWLNVGIIIWATFFMALAIYWIAWDLGGVIA